MEESERQSLFASVHYNVGRITQEVELDSNTSVRCTRQFIFCLSDFVYKIMERLGSDVESFAKHAKRSTVQIEDVLLCARRNESFVFILFLISRSVDHFARMDY